MFCRNCGSSIDHYSKCCVHCGTPLLNNPKYCPVCGSKITKIEGFDTESKQNAAPCLHNGNRPRTIYQILTDKDNINTDFSPLPKYYQEEFSKILKSNETYKGKLNWAAFFFGIFWALSKGLWCTAVIGVILSLPTYGIAGIIYGFVLGFRGNYIYYNAYVKMKHAKTHVNNQPWF